MGVLMCAHDVVTILFGSVKTTFAAIVSSIALLISVIFYGYIGKHQINWIKSDD